MTATDRASKKQRELLSFVDSFIKGNGYGPSYREIMRALGYKSVSTVAVHIDGLIAKGYLVKRTRSARSLEVVTTAAMPAPAPDGSEEHRRWLAGEVNRKLDDYTGGEKDDLEHLVESLRLLGLDSDYAAARRRLEKLV